MTRHVPEMIDIPDLFLCAKGVRKFAIGRFYVKLHSLGNLGVSQGLTLAGRPQRN
jgi:sulfur relay (sulfurtransferase) DsrF/TusC family protein